MKFDVKLNLDLDGKKPEEQVQIVNANLKEISDGLKRYAEATETEINAKGNLTQETKTEVDKLLLTQTEMKGSLDALMQEIENIPRTPVEQKGPKSLGHAIISAEGTKEGLNAMKEGGRGANFSQSVKMAMTNDSLGIADPDRVAGIAGLGMQRLMIRDLFRKGRTTSDSVQFWRQTARTNNAAAVSENPSAGKPESSIGGSLQTANVVTIAHFEKASKQVLSDTAMLQSFIDNDLRYGLRVAEEDQLLYGDGTGINMNGVHTQATAYSEPSGVNVSNETRADRLRLGILQTELSDFYADSIVLGLVDWCNIELQKDSQNAYLFANPFGMMIPTLWGRPVAASASVDTGDWLVGAFQTAATLWDRELMSVSIAYENQDDFIKNMVTLLCELREALTIKQTTAFTKGDFSGVNT